MPVSSISSARRRTQCGALALVGDSVSRCWAVTWWGRGKIRAGRGLGTSQPATQARTNAATMQRLRLVRRVPSAARRRMWSSGVSFFFWGASPTAQRRSRPARPCRQFCRRERLSRQAWWRSWAFLWRARAACCRACCATCRAACARSACSCADARADRSGIAARAAFHLPRWLGRVG